MPVPEGVFTEAKSRPWCCFPPSAIRLGGNSDRSAHRQSACEFHRQCAKHLRIGQRGVHPQAQCRQLAQCLVQRIEGGVGRDFLLRLVGGDMIN
jgi:hypothetical protein